MVLSKVVSSKEWLNEFGRNGREKAGNGTSAIERKVKASKRARTEDGITRFQAPGLDSWREKKCSVLDSMQ